MISNCPRVLRGDEGCFTNKLMLQFIRIFIDILNSSNIRVPHVTCIYKIMSLDEASNVSGKQGRICTHT